MKNTLVIRSGGQTGVDRAALDAAIKLNLQTCGWCPKGRIAEDGIIPSKYKLVETLTENKDERTRLNVKNSDGTLVLLLSESKVMNDGTSLAIKTTKSLNKPLMFFYLEKVNIDIVINWIFENEIIILNVAGPTESNSPGIYNSSYNYMNKKKIFLNIIQSLSYLILLRDIT